jgi:hypothetical protein
MAGRVVTASRAAAAAVAPPEALTRQSSLTRPLDLLQQQPQWGEQSPIQPASQLSSYIPPQLTSPDTVQQEIDFRVTKEPSELVKSILQGELSFTEEDPYTITLTTKRMILRNPSRWLVPDEDEDIIQVEDEGEGPVTWGGETMGIVR